MRKLFILTLVFIMSEQVLAIFSIDQVTISPANPTSSDTITIEANGAVNFAGWTFDHSSFTANDKNLTLDFYFDVPDYVFWIMTTWDESKQIGTLSADDYNLTVHTYSITSSGTGLDDTFQTSFTATPEPMTIALLGLGAAIAIRKHR